MKTTSITSFTLRELPLEERPRERMQVFGPSALSHAELLAVLLRTGTVQESAVTLAQRLLQKHGGIRQLLSLSVEQLVETKGVGTAKALQIQAAMELAKRLASSRIDATESIRSPKDAAAYLIEELRYLQKEHFVCLFLNTKNKVVGKEILSVGTLNASLVHPREVFLAAIKKNSAAIICAHNHPSGDPSPSPEDIELTRRLVEAGELLGIEVLDHLIIGDQQFTSLKEQDLM